jgi:hypothetical protein
MTVLAHHIHESKKRLRDLSLHTARASERAEAVTRIAARQLATDDSAQDNHAGGDARQP